MLRKSVIIDQNLLSLRVLEDAQLVSPKLKLVQSFEIMCPDSVESIKSSYQKVNLISTSVSVYEAESLVDFEKQSKYTVPFSELCREKSWRADWFYVSSSELPSIEQPTSEIPIFTLLLPMIKTGVDAMVIGEVIKRYLYIFTFFYIYFLELKDFLLFLDRSILR